MQDFKDSQLLSAEDIYAQVLNVQRENEENQKKEIDDFVNVKKVEVKKPVPNK